MDKIWNFGSLKFFFFFNFNVLIAVLQTKYKK